MQLICCIIAKVSALLSYSCFLEIIFLPLQDAFSEDYLTQTYRGMKTYHWSLLIRDLLVEVPSSISISLHPIPKDTPDFSIFEVTPISFC